MSLTPALAARCRLASSLPGPRAPVSRAAYAGVVPPPPLTPATPFAGWGLGVGFIADMTQARVAVLDWRPISVPQDRNWADSGTARAAVIAGQDLKCLSALKSSLPNGSRTRTTWTWCCVPGIEGELGILPHHTPLVSLLGVGELTIRKGGEEELFAIAGGFLQVRPDKVVVMAETADLDSEIDLEKAKAARDEAEKALEGGYVEGADLSAARAELGRAPCCGSGDPGGRGPASGGSAPARLTPPGTTTWLTLVRFIGSISRTCRPRRPSGSRADARCRAPCTSRGAKNRRSSCSRPRS